MGVKLVSFQKDRECTCFAVEANTNDEAIQIAKESRKHLHTPSSTASQADLNNNNNYKAQDLTLPMLELLLKIAEQEEDYIGQVDSSLVFLISKKSQVFREKMNLSF